MAYSLVRFFSILSFLALVESCAQAQQRPPSQIVHPANVYGDSCPHDMLLKANFSLASWIEQGSPACLPASTDNSIFCLYIDPSFASGRGIAIIETPDAASTLLASIAALKSHSYGATRTQASQRPFKVQELAGRGLGVVAIDTISRDDVLLEEAPVYLAHSTFGKKVSAASSTILRSLAIAQLPPSTSEMVRRLYGADSRGLVDGILDANTFVARLSDAADETRVHRFEALFPDIARINHDCRPNAFYYFNASSLTQRVSATRTIYPGEEITIAYFDPLESVRFRREQLQRVWSFECACSLCASSPLAVMMSDQRVDQIIEFEGQLLGSSLNATARLDKALLLQSLLDEENLQYFMPESHVYLAEAYLGLGRYVRALEHARLAVAAGSISGQDGSPRFQRMRRLTDRTPAI